MTDNNTKILIVDDDPRNLKVLEVMLHAQGHGTLRANSGKDALQLAMQELPDLILLDVMMPDMNGFEVVERLKSTPPTSSIPIIMITSLDDRESHQYALQAGADEFISKPVNQAELSVRVKTLLQLRDYRQRDKQK